MRVVLKRCEEYNLELIKKHIYDSLNELDFFSKINKDSKVCIKLNCVGPFEPSKAITTNPIFTQAVIQIIKEKTLNIVIGDNPATKDLTYTLKKCGLYDIIQQENIKIFNGAISETIINSNSIIYKSFDVSKEIISSDIIINLPKLKTHTLAYMTVAQKNFFGLIHGLSKAGWHVKASNPLQFGNAINDLYGALKESFKDKTIINICDGIVGLEGEGPSTGGKAVKGNVILTSYDAVSLDRVALEIVKLDINKLFINKIAGERNLGENDLRKIEIIGNPIEDFKDVKFLSPKDTLSSFGLRFVKIKLIRNILLEHPVIDTSKCIKCGECAKICPPKAMKIVPNHFPHLTPKMCIRCWCCSEVCPQNAITKTKRPLIGKIFLKSTN